MAPRGPLTVGALQEVLGGCADKPGPEVVVGKKKPGQCHCSIFGHHFRWPLFAGEGPRALLLAPTRELVIQIGEEVKAFRLLAGVLDTFFAWFFMLYL